MNKTKSPIFTLIVDEERSKILNLIIASILEDGLVIPEFQDACIRYGISFEALESFTNEVNDKTHEHEWCSAPNCTYHEEDDE